MVKRTFHKESWRYFQNSIAITYKLWSNLCLKRVFWPKEVLTYPVTSRNWNLKTCSAFKNISITSMEWSFRCLRTKTFVRKQDCFRTLCTCCSSIWSKFTTFITSWSQKYLTDTRRHWLFKKWRKLSSCTRLSSNLTKLSKERLRTFLLCLDLCSNLQIITFLMQSLRRHLKRYLIKRELGELMMRKISNSAVIWLCRITMRIDINLIKMMKILEMMTWTFFLMFERLRSSQQIRVLNDLILKVKINNLQKSI